MQELDVLNRNCLCSGTVGYRRISDLLKRIQAGPDSSLQPIFIPPYPQKPFDDTTVALACSKSHIQAPARHPPSCQTSTRSQTSLSKRDKWNDDGEIGGIFLPLINASADRVGN